MKKKENLKAKSDKSFTGTPLLYHITCKRRLQLLETLSLKSKKPNHIKPCIHLTKYISLKKLPHECDKS